MLLNRSHSAILGKDWKVQSQLFSARENSKLWVFFSIKTWICPRNPVSIQELWLFFWTHYFRILWNKMPNTGRHLLKLCLILIFFSDLLPVYDCCWCLSFLHYHSLVCFILRRSSGLDYGVPEGVAPVPKFSTVPKQKRPVKPGVTQRKVSR